MSEETPWRRLWADVDAALFAHGERLAKGEAEFLKEVRLAVTRYGRAVAPGSFDEYGQPREAAEGGELTSQYCACGDEVEKILVGQDLDPSIFVCRRCQKIWADGWKWG